MMDVAILHFHLGHGGVTRVIANHLLSLAGHCPKSEPLNAIVLHGGRKEGWPDDLDLPENATVQTQVIPELEYNTLKPPPSPQTLTDRIDECLHAAGFSPATCVLHIHNHSLGKNVAFPPAIASLADRGYAQLLQLHDFSEDFRPGNYTRLREACDAEDSAGLGRWLYPQGQRIHYAVLNSRDLEILKNAGFPRVHLLPNPVFDAGPAREQGPARGKLAVAAGIPEDCPYALYPVRAIRRKNIGEAILWSALSADSAYFAVSLPTLNPAEQPGYEDWKQLVTRLRLPFRFELGTTTGLTFAENLAAADHLLTTSLAEGFGMVFLETWLAGRDLLGRDLPDITADFVNRGLDLGNMYSTVRIPSELVDRKQLLDTLTCSYERVCGQYGFEEKTVRQALPKLEAKVFGDFIDFGDLDESFQATIIKKVVDSPQVREHIKRNNPQCVSTPAGNPSMRERIAENANRVRHGFGPEPVGKQLMAIYQTLLEGSAGASNEVVNPDKILTSFLAPERFRLLRT